MSRANDPVIKGILAYMRGVNIQNPEYAEIKRILEEGVSGRYLTHDERIRRLRLREGDILVVKDRDTLLRLVQTPHNISFQVPVVLAPKGIRRVSREHIKKLLEETA